MKKFFLTAGFIVSLALNLGVAVAIGWELWLRHSFQSGKPGPELSLSPEELTRAKARFSANRQMKRQQMLQKRAELLDLVTRDPQDANTCQQTLDEYLAISTEMDRERIANIREVMFSLSTENRQILLLLLKERITGAKGRGPGWSAQGASGRGWTSPMTMKVLVLRDRRKGVLTVPNKAFFLLDKKAEPIDTWTHVQLSR